MKVTMKMRMLLALMLTGVMSVWAQSPYTWNADNWEYATGTGSQYGDALVSKSIAWGCVQLKTKSSFTLTQNQTYIVVRGFTLTGGTNNPNIADINGTSYQSSFKGTNDTNGKFTLNAAGTMLYADLSSILPVAVNGTRTISSFKLTLNATDEDFPIITSIEFVNGVPTNDAGLSHPCMLHTDADFERIQQNITQSPWKEAYAHLQASSYAQSTYTNKTNQLGNDGTLKRMDYNNWGPNGSHGQYSDYNNFTALMNDAAAAYQLALRYKVSGDTQYANAAVNILNAWKNNCKGILRLSGYSYNIPDPNLYLIMIQGHQIANAAELLRNYSGWAAEDFEGFKKWMRITFLDIAMICLAQRTPGLKHQWLNWDLASLTAVLSVGILCDDKSTIDWVMNFVKNEHGLYDEVGNLRNAIPYLHQDPDSGEELGQCQESGRDQGHATLCVSLMGTLCQMAKNCGTDLFAYDDYRALKMAEYVAKHNLITDASWNSTAVFAYDVASIPYTTYTTQEYNCTTISNDGRGTKRPAWELFYGYAKEHGLSAKYCKKWAEQMRELNSYQCDGGGGDYGNNSGGFDQLGYGSLTYAIPDEDVNLTTTIGINVDTHIRSDNTSSANGTAANTEIYNNTSGSREFVQLINLTMPDTPIGHNISKVTLRLVSKRAKGVARNGINVYAYPNTVTNAATWGSEGSYISTARISEPITTFEVAGEAGKDVVADNISSDYYDIALWTNDIDITSYAINKGGEDINLMLAAANGQTNGDQVCFFARDCAASYENSKTSQTYYKKDLVPQLIVEYVEFPKTDMIDHSTGIPLTNNLVSTGTTYDNTEGKRVLLFTPTSAGEIGITLKTFSEYTVDNTQNFFVIETNGGAIDASGSRFKCRSMKLDGKTYDGNTTDMKAIITVGDRQVLILSPLGQGNSSNEYTPIFEKFHNTPDGTSITVNEATVYFTVASTSKVTVYRAGLYNLGEILELYPTLKGRNWQFVAANGLRLESYGDNSGANASDGTIRIKPDNSSKSTYAIFQQQMRSLGRLPYNFTLANYNSFLLEDGTIATTDDLLTPLSIPQIQFNENLLRFFPTLTPKKVKANGSKYWAYKDGIAPLKSTFYVDNSNSSKRADFTRRFLHGYNSCILPFELDVTTLPDGWVAYTFYDYTSNGTLRFERKDYTIAVNTPFLIKVPNTATEGLYVITATPPAELLMLTPGEASSSSSNGTDPIDPTSYYYPTMESNGVRFVGSYVNEVATNDYGSRKYGVDKSGELMLMGSNIKTTYYRAFIAMDTQAGNNAKEVFFSNNALTGITNAKDNIKDNGSVLYDLSGRKVAEQYSNSSPLTFPLSKGIYIYKGKKIVKK